MEELKLSIMFSGKSLVDAWISDFIRNDMARARNAHNHAEDFSIDKVTNFIEANNHSSIPSKHNLIKNARYNYS